MSRTKNAIRNSAFGIISKLATLALGVVVRTIFIYSLGNEYLGVNSLYSEILAMLSLAELGFGSAIAYAMYEPVAKNDEQKLLKLIDYFRTVYRFVALTITVVGLALVPFLDKLVQGAPSISLTELRVYYLMFLFNTVISYFVTYKYSVINAMQKDYIITNIDLIVYVTIVIAQGIVLVLFNNFFAYLLSQSLVLLASRILITKFLEAKFDIFKKKTSIKLSVKERKEIFTNVKGLMLHRLAGVSINSTDNLVISVFTELGVIGVALVSNYNMIIRTGLGFIDILFASVTSGLGNMASSESKEDFYAVFKQLNFLNFWLYGICCIGCFVLVPSIIVLWIGETYIIDSKSFLLIVISAYFVGQSKIYSNTRGTKGHFEKDQWLALVEAFVNIVVSIICANMFGLFGVYIGTLSARLFFLATRPLTLFPFLFGVSAKEYYQKLVQYFVVTFGAGAVTYWITKPILNEVTWINLLLGAMCVLVVPNVIFFCFYAKNTELKAIIYRVRMMLK